MATESSLENLLQAAFISVLLVLGKASECLWVVNSVPLKLK